MDLKVIKAILALLSICRANSQQPSKFQISPVGTQVEFANVGQIWGTVADHHLVLQLNYDPLQQSLSHIRTLCEHLKAVHKDSGVQGEARRLKKRCDNTADRMSASLKQLDTIFKPKKGRSKRFVNQEEGRKQNFVTLAAGALGLGIGSFVSYEVTHLIEKVTGTEGPNPDVVTLLQEHESSITREQDEINHLNQTMTDFAVQLIHQKEDFDYKDIIDRTLISLINEEQHFYLVSNALIELVHQVLSPHLIDTKIVKNALK